MRRLGGGGLRGLGAIFGWIACLGVGCEGSGGLERGRWTVGMSERS
jgi:hypothetical protein